MSRDNDLPFAIGTTYCNGDATAIANLTGELEGREFVVKDATTGLKKTLVVLKNNSGSDLVNKGGFGVRYSSGYIKRRAAGLVNSAGALGHIVDPSYATQTIASGDLFYAVLDGYVNAANIGADVAANDVVAFDSAGRLAPVSGAHTAGLFVVGYSDSTTTYVSGGAEETVAVHVGLTAGWDTN